MKKYLVAMLFFLPLLGWGQKEYSLMGTDFWVSIPNGLGIDSLYLYASSRDTCTVTFSFDNYTFVKHSDYHYYYGPSVVRSTVYGPGVSFNIGAQYVHTNLTNRVMRKSIHVTSTDSIALHAYAYGANGGATSVIPTQALQPEYVVQTFPDSVGTAFVVVATEDSTLVDIFLTNPSSDHLPTNRHLTVLLNAGNTYQLVSTPVAPDTTSTFSGTRISSRHNKKIAVFQSNRQMTFYHNESSRRFKIYDYTMEQAVPVAYWGNDFHPDDDDPFSYRGTSFSPYSFIITALKDSCIVSIYDPIGYNATTVIDTLDAFESLYFDSMTTFFNWYRYYFSTSEPANMYLYKNNNGKSDCVYIAAAGSGGYEGYLSPDYFYQKSLDSSSFHSNYHWDDDQLTIHVDTNVLQSPIDISHWGALRAGTNYNNGWWHILDIAHWGYRLHSSSRFHAHKAGRYTLRYSFPPYDYYTPSSYTYNACYNMIFWNKIFYGDGIPNNTLHLTSFCLGHDIEFNTNCDTNQTYFHWDFGDGQTAIGPIVHHTYSSPGTYRVQSIIDFSNTPMSDHSRDTLYGTVNIAIPDTVTFRDSSCTFPYTWNDTLLAAPGTYLSHNTGISDCEVVYQLILTQDTTSVRTHLSDTLCQGDSLAWHSQMLFATGLYADTLSQSNGCDSIVLLDLSVWSRPDVSIRQTTPEGKTPIHLQGTARNAIDSYHFWWESRPEDVTLHNQEQQLEITVSPDVKTIYTLTAEYDSLPGCITSAQYIGYPQPLEALWIPNTFTPNLQTNTAFDIIGTEISEFHIAIYNRQGLIVFQSDDIHQSWDGTYNGNPCPTGAYAYAIRYSHTNNPSFILRKSGTVTLLR